MTTANPVRLSDLPDGLHYGLPAEVYHERALGIISRTALEKFSRAPQLYRAWTNGVEEESTSTLEFGTATHCAILEPEVFARTYVVEPKFGDCRKTDNRAARDAWRASNDGKRLLSATDAAHLLGMSGAIRAHPLASEMLKGGASEVTALWRHESTGLRCKARGDYYVESRRMLVDLKTTEDARPEAFARSVAKFGYHRQRAFYGDGFAACGHPIEHFVFVVIERTPPYLIAVYTLDLEATVRGREAISAAMAELDYCITADTFPGYPMTITTVSLPPWAA